MTRRNVVLATSLTLLLTSACEPELGALRSDLDAGTPDDAALSSSDAFAVSEDGAVVEGGIVPPVNFARDIRPILGRSDGPPAGCKRCHYRASPAPQGYDLGGIDLTTLGTLRKGGISSGPEIVIPGDPDRSVIVKKLEGTYSRGARMPKDLTPLSASEIALIRRWIAEGAVGGDNE